MFTASTVRPIALGKPAILVPYPHATADHQRKNARWMVEAGAALLVGWALPWLALGWALYGLYLVLVTIAGRAKVTVRTLPAAAAGLVVNVGVLIWLVPSLGVVGAAIALGAAYVAMLVVLFLLTRNVFRVPFEWGRLVPLVLIVSVFSVAGDLLIPNEGLAGFVARAVVLLALAPTLVAARVVTISELRILAEAVRSRRVVEAG